MHLSQGYKGAAAKKADDYVLDDEDKTMFLHKLLVLRTLTTHPAQAALPPMDWGVAVREEVRDAGKLMRDRRDRRAWRQSKQ
jgi:hypothetical protein